MIIDQIKQEILEDYRKLYNNFPTSGMWYESVESFLSDSLDRVEEEMEKEVRETIINKIEAKFNQGVGSYNIIGWNEAVRDILESLKKGGE